jgi:N-acetylglucosaminyl-diphospho-decaprenol L-rhamnosyltransferase
MTSPDLGSATPTIGVVTVSYRSGAVLKGFLESIGPATAASVAVVVADNAPSGEGSVETIATHAGAHYLPLPENDGYGAGMNAAVATLPASVEWVLVSNPDVVLSPGSIDALIAVGAEDDSIGAVGPAVINDDGSVYPSARAVPSLRTGIGHALFVNLWAANPWTAAYRNDSETQPCRRDTGWLSGSCLLVRRSAFTELNGFDPGYFMYFEDVDLGFRLGKAGYRSVYEPSVSINHAGAHSTTTESDRMVKAHHASARRFLAKKYPGPLLWPVRVTLSIGLFLRSALVRRGLTH